MLQALPPCQEKPLLFFSPNELMAKQYSAED
jgi:hypothetical protein